MLHLTLSTEDLFQNKPEVIEERKQVFPSLIKEKKNQCCRTNTIP